MRYTIHGEPMPVVVCELDAGESMINESGSMAWMSPNMKMETTSGGGIGKVFGRLISGEKLFQNVYTAERGPGMIAFSSSFPGVIRAVEITPDRPIIAQKSAFLAATAGVSLSIHFQKKAGAGFFGGEGFVMQQISGSGIAFLEIDGSAMEYELRSGEQMIVDTGHLAMADPTVGIDVQMVKGVKNVVFGGEGLFNTVLTGPGKIVLQTMPISRFMGLISAHLPSSQS
ncbi:MAG: TIGR00266 family protein [Clostridia bacterium]|nr:TIGR00266 family protein [Clostridia bacterium]